MYKSSLIRVALASALLIAASNPPAPAAAAVTIVVNGATVSFDQPPIERSGRVFVPLRGVFERMGATVVYDNGLINATGNGRNISLRIGSTAATINGQNYTSDVAPFLVGARTLVPLRFISEALGAAVNYDSGNQTVSISTNGGSSGSGSSQPVALTNLSPPDQGVVQSSEPAVSATFSQTVDPNSVKVTIDSRDVTSATAISPTDFLFTPPYALSTASHTVRVVGTSSTGSSFDSSWSFTSGTSTNDNYLHDLQPSSGSMVGGSFTVSGTALPNSRVHIVAASVAIVNGVFRMPAGSYNADVIADANGSFSQVVTINVVSGGNVTVRLTASKPTSNSATITLHLKS
ncbi:MAG TPA: copper amine oxidase N-terminal domain-containing protein [Candidatus Eremiobacteraceae bacterium]